MRKGDLADGSRVRHEGGVRTGFVCKLRLQAPTHPFERCSADTTVCLVDATTFCDSLHCVPCAVSFRLLASTASCIHDFSYPRLIAAPMQEAVDGIIHFPLKGDTLKKI